MKNAALIFLILTLTAVAGCSQMSSADGARGGRYGAIAYSPTTKAWRMRWNVGQQQRAIELAKQDCGKSDCGVILLFGPSQCGTFALGDGGVVGVGVSRNAKQAADTAMAHCASEGSGCKVAPPHCNR